MTVRLLVLLLALEVEESLGCADVDGAWSANEIVNGACDEDALSPVLALRYVTRSRKDVAQTQSLPSRRQYLQSGVAF